MVETGLLDAARRNREAFAWLALGFVGARLLVEFMALFVDRGFVVNAAAGGHLDLVSPVQAAALALAVWLVSVGGQATARGRLVVQVALGLVAALLLVGVVTWLGGLTLEFGLSAGAKTMASLRFLVDGALLGVAGWFGLLVLPSMPVPERTQPQYGPAPYSAASWQPQYGQPQYGQPQYEQPQWGQPQYGQPQYGQPQYGQPQWEQPQWGQPQDEHWTEPQYGPQDGSSPWGESQQPEPQAPDPPDAERTQEFVAGLEPDPLPPRGLSIFDDPSGPADTDPRRPADTDPSGPAEEPADRPDGWPGRRS